MQMPDKTHYDALGVKKTATAAQIKTAYRKKSRKAHPDIGGTQEAQAELNRAYECLGDPQRRLTYDETGRDDPLNTLAIEARNCLLDAFDQLISNKIESGCIGHIEKVLKKQRDQLDVQRSEGTVVLNDLENRRDKIRLKNKSEDADSNLFQMVLNQKTDRVKAALSQIKQRIEAITIALKMLNEYESVDEVSAAIITVMPRSNRTHSGSFGIWTTVS
jgi:curved DNA-binding protein CbpA